MRNDQLARLKILSHCLGTFLINRALEVAEAAVAEPDPHAKEALQQLCIAHWRAGMRLLKREGRRER